MTNLECNQRIVERKIENPPIKVSYPELQGLKNSEAQEKINTAIYDLITRMIEKQQQPWIDDPDFKLAEMEGTYKITLNKNCLLSIRFENYAYFAGAAHGLTIVNSITANLGTGKIYVLKDLFVPNSSYRVKINRLIEKQIREEELTLINDFEGITDYQSFYLTETDLIIYYQLYELTPYAFGIPEFKILYRYLQAILNRKSPITLLS